MLQVGKYVPNWTPPNQTSGIGGVWPTQPVWRSEKRGYANHVEVERNEHDAVFRFYRKTAKTSALVSEVTVPLSVLDALLA